MIPRSTTTLLVCAALTLGGVAGCRCASGGAGQAKSKRKNPAVVVVDPSEQAAPVAEREPNDDRAGAMPLEAETTLRARIASGKDVDWYKVELKGDKPQVLSAKVSVEGKLDVVLSASDASGRFLVKVNNSGPGEGERLVNLMASPGTLYLRVARAIGAKSRTRKRRRKGRKLVKAPAEAPKPVEQGDYALRFGWRTPEAGEEREPNWKRSLASELALGEEAVGYFGWRTDTDWYRVTLSRTDIAPTDRLRVELDGVDGVWSSLSVYDSRLKLIQRRRGRPGEVIVLPHLLRPAGDQIFAVVRCGRTFNTEARYSLRVSAEPAAGATEIEPNDRITRATALEVGQPQKGVLADTYDRDVFALKIAQPGLLRATVTPPLALDVAIAIIDGMGKVVKEVDDAGPGKPEVLTSYLVRPPVAYLRLRARKPRDVDPVGSYRLFAQVTAPGASEREPNSTLAQATPWIAGWAEVTGHLYPRNDVDTFVLPAEIPPNTTLALSPPDEVKTKLEVLVDGKVRSQTTAVDQRGQLTLQVDEADVNKRIVVRITAISGSNAAKPYRLSRQSGAASPAPGSGTSGSATPVAPIAPIAPVAPSPAGASRKEG
ncbi:MAG: hypothetical protein CSA24_00900 [Deltaproteobacteria bacterium]|nr:MAG: hypothetical protein CSB49_06170 [Pseudomonadota bacterium]PIE66144.1 MAG: hypothetical protein CSA24_00900 [Deltaproteobacteria bacterium]